MNKKRLEPSIFNIPVDKIKSGYYTDKYFVHSRNILMKDNRHTKVLMQIFSRADGILCGIDEAIAILKLCADESEKLKIHALHDGDEIKKNETVMTIEGDYSTFAHLETVYLGVLSRGTSVATATKKVVEAASGKEVLFFPARYDHYLNQPSDGYAAYIGGALLVSTDAQGEFFHKEGVGTMPHGLIAVYGGDTVEAAIAFDKYLPENIKRIVLVDFDNDCIGTSLKVAKVLGKKLWGVRFDTADDLIDKSVTGRSAGSYGVCAELCFKAREIFDREGYNWIKIVVSSGFNSEKLRKFIEQKVPFDAVGIGSVLFRNRIDFTADVVLVEGSGGIKHCAKVGRKYNPNPRLELVE
ncbi:MAG: quinolinate phosphoribosyl transferase [Elusimicrobiota bacterium]|nr:quinolinate phosphoribosyl transferase [Elusimicrobiota bacterium]